MQTDSINLVSRVLGAYTYYSPVSETVQPLTPLLLNISEIFDWKDRPLIETQQEILNQYIDDEKLEYQFLRLFHGMGPMPAPPWGSVYLDKENLLMGETTERYRIFLYQHNLHLDTGMNEPEDQFGLMLMAFALFLENGDLETAKTLLQDHLMIWAPRYLHFLKSCELSPFYEAIAIIAESFLNQLAEQFEITVPFYRLYR